jgi:hypothetical protein
MKLVEELRPELPAFAREDHEFDSLVMNAEIRARDLIDDRAAYVARMKNLAHSGISWQGIPYHLRLSLSSRRLRRGS